jgi:hypothetical protein
MQMFILLPPLFSIMFHGHGPAGGDVAALGSEIGSRKETAQGPPYRRDGGSLARAAFEALPMIGLNAINLVI